MAAGVAWATSCRIACTTTNGRACRSFGSLPRNFDPVRRRVHRLIDACEHGADPMPGVAEGYRVKCLIDATRREHATGRWIDVAPQVGRSSNLISAGLRKPYRPIRACRKIANSV